MCQRALDRALAAECPFNPHGELLNDRIRDPDSTQGFLRKTHDRSGRLES